MKARLSSDGRSILIRIPYRFRRTGGRKAILAPEGSDSAFPPPARPDEPLIRALVRGFRWRELLESGQAASVQELAAREKTDPSYLTRTLRLTLLAPDLVEAILDGRQPEHLTLERLKGPLPVEWEEQRDTFF